MYRFMDKKRAEGKPYLVYMTAGANKFLRIYYGRVKRISGISGGKLRKHPSLLGNDTAFTLKASYDRKRAIKMFLDNLSTSILKLCDTRKLSYEAASERCDLSSRYFGDIARGKTAPTILTLEKLCVGFDLTPNDLLIPQSSGREWPSANQCRLHISAAFDTSLA